MVHLPAGLRQWGVRTLGRARLAALLGNSTAVHTTMERQFGKKVKTQFAKEQIVFHLSGLDKFGVAKIRSDLALGGPNAHTTT